MRTATIYNYLVEATLIGSLLSVAALLLRPVIRKAVGSRMLCLVWLLVALRLLVPLALPNPAMNALKPMLSQDAGIRPMADQVRTRVEDTAHSLYWKTFGTDTQRTPLHALLWRVVRATGNGKIAGLLLGVYAGGFALALCWMVLLNLRMRHVLRRRVGGLTAEEQSAYETMCRLRGWKPLPVCRVADLPGSTLMGCVKPVILIPDDAGEDVLPAMLLRETCHHHRGDNWFANLRCLCCALHWFNPVVWVASHASRIDVELACDEHACAPMAPDDRRAYAKWLMRAREIHHTTPSPMLAATALTMRERPQRTRIRTALHPIPRKKWAAWVFCGVCLMVCAGMFATAETTSLSNVPELSSPAIRSEATRLTDAHQAERYARAFLTLEGVEVDTQGQSMLLFKTESGWQAEVYPAGETKPCYLVFDETGMILSFENTGRLAAKLNPLAEPITTQSAEGRQWCDFLSAFLQRHMPECWQSFEVMNIVDSGRLDGERYITVQLADVENVPLWEAAVQVAPEGRILSITRTEDDE